MCVCVCVCVCVSNYGHKREVASCNGQAVTDKKLTGILAELSDHSYSEESVHGHSALDGRRSPRRTGPTVLASGGGHRVSMRCFS